MTCVFNNCELSTNMYSTFASHKNRKHTPHSLEHFKPSIMENYTCQIPEDTELSVDESDSRESVVEEEHDFIQIVNNKLGCLFLKLESVLNVSNRCIDEIVDELQFISSTASRPVIKQISDFVENLTSLNPLNAALGVDRPFNTSYKRGRFLKEQFHIVEPVEYILDEQSTFQYVPILQTLSKVLEKNGSVLKKYKALSMLTNHFVMVHISKKIAVCLEIMKEALLYSTLMILRFVIRSGHLGKSTRLLVFIGSWEIFVVYHVPL